MIDLGKTFADGIKVVNDCIYVGNVRVRIVKRPTKGATRRTEGLSKQCRGSVNQWTKGRPVGKSTVCR